DVVHHHVELSVSRRDLPHPVARARLVRDVQPQWHRIAAASADARRDGVGQLEADVAGDDLRAGLGERLADRLSQSTSAARHESDLAGKLLRHRSPSFRFAVARRRTRQCAERPRISRTFGARPLVLIPINTSPARPSAWTCRANTSSYPTSFDHAVSTAVSAPSAIAGSPGRSAHLNRPTSSPAKCCASAALPPLPQIN